MPVDLSTLRANARNLLKRYLRADETERTPILRAIAECFVDAREHFERPDGSPDWKGRTHAYRMWVRDTVTDAGVPKEEHATVQSAVRYHVGNVLRERLDEETREEYGLIQRSPRERSADRRESRTAILQALTSRDLSGGALMSLTAAHAVLNKVEPKDLDELEGHALTVADAALTELERKVRALRRRLASRD